MFLLQYPGHLFQLQIYEPAGKAEELSRNRRSFHKDFPSDLVHVNNPAHLDYL
jgi:hypothetical protein